MKKIYSLSLLFIATAITVFTSVILSSCESNSQSEQTEQLDSVLIDRESVVEKLTTERNQYKQEKYTDSVYLNIPDVVFRAIIIELTEKDLKKIGKEEIVREYIERNYEYNLILSGSELQKEIDNKVDSVIVEEGSVNNI